MSKKSGKGKKRSKKQLAEIDAKSADRAQQIERAKAKLARALVDLDVARTKVARRERDLAALMADEEDSVDGQA